MKRLLAISMSVCLLFGMTACNKTESEETMNPQQQQQETQQQEQTEISQEQALSKMVQPIDALVRCMLENGMNYEPENPEFFWSALYYFASAYGTEHQLAEVSDDMVQLPRMAVQELATVLFADYNDLLALPDSMSGRVTYDESYDSYQFSRGDIGLSETILDIQQNNETEIVAHAKLVSKLSEDDIIGEWNVTMIPNAYADGITDAMYVYTVSSVTPIQSQDTTQSTTSDSSQEIPATSESDTITITATFGGLSDSHTVELTLSDGSFRAFQFTDDAVRTALEQCEIGDSITATYTDDGVSATIIEIL